MSNPQWWQPHRHADRRPALLARGRIQRAIRGWLDDNDFIEVDPAALQVSPGNETHLHAFATAAIGNPVVMVSMVAVFIAIFFAGFSIIGGQPALNALAATYYPTSLRSTGIGWSLGIGRIGSIVGPVLGGQLIRWQWSDSAIFLAMAS